MQLLPYQPDLKDSPIGRLYQRYWLTMFTAICRHISSQEDAEDILLDVFLIAMENDALLKMSPQHQEAWLRRVAYNKCMDFHRHAKQQSIVPLKEHIENFFDDDSYSPPQAALRQEELSELRTHLATLSTSQQELLRMRFAEELPYSQIAARMNKSEGAIRTMLTRTLHLLRNIYSGRKEENHHA